MSFSKVMVGLEEFTEEVNSEITPAQPTDGAFDETTAGVDFQEESEGIDSDLDSISTAAQGLEDIISLVEEAPGEGDQPLQPFAEKAANVALESNDMVVAAGNPLAATDDKGSAGTKDGVIEKLKAFALKVWEMLRSFGKKIADWIRETWAKFTDRIVKNANSAKKILASVSTMATRQGAKITDKGLLAKIATFKNAEVGDVLLSVTEYTNDQGSKEAEALTKEARACIDVVSSGASTADGVIDRFLEALKKSAGSYSGKASPEQAQAVKALAGSETYISDPFFAGYRAWTTVPDNAEKLQLWNHGISKMDEVKAQDSIDAPGSDEIKAIAQHVIGFGALVAVYQANIKNLDTLNKSLDQAASKAKNAKSESAQLKQMQAVVPRIIKGPQVAAYAYAASASTTALQYCLAAIAAHGTDPDAKSMGDKAKDAASAAGDKVKGAFGGKKEAE